MFDKKLKESTTYKNIISGELITFSQGTPLKDIDSNFKPLTKKEALENSFAVEKMKMLEIVKAKQFLNVIKYNNDYFQADLNSVENMQLAFNTLRDNEIIEWVNADNKITKLTKKDLANILTKIRETRTQNILKIKQLKESLAECKNINELNKWSVENGFK